MAWENEGTVSVANGSQAVTGVGTRFDTRVRVGDGLLTTDGKIYEVTNVIDSTTLTITPEYNGTTAANQSYKIVPVRGYGKLLADLLREGMEVFGDGLDLPDWISPFNKSGAQSAIADEVPEPNAIPRTDNSGKLHTGYLPNDVVILDAYGKIPLNNLAAKEAYSADTLILTTADGTIHLSRFDIEGLTGAIVGMFSILVQSILSRSTSAQIRTDLELGTAAEANVVQNTGNSEEDVMSQNAVTLALNSVMSKFESYGLTPYTNTNQTPANVGHILAGKTFSEFTFTDLMDELFYPSGGVTTTEAYNYVINVDDTGTLLEGGKDNDLVSVTGTVLSVSATEGITAKALYPFGTAVVISEGQGTAQHPSGGQFSINSDGSFTFDLKTAYAAVNKNQKVSVVLEYKLLNVNQSQVVPGKITINVHGTNKTPVVKSAITTKNYKSLGVVSYNLKQHFEDPNTGQTASLVITASGLPSDLSLTTAGVMTGTFGRLAHETPTHSVTVRATDSFGAYVEQTFTINIARATVVAKDKAVSTNADNPVTVTTGTNNLLNGITSDGTLDTVGLKVTKVDGQPVTGSITIETGLQGKITVQETGEYTFDPNSEFDNAMVGTNVVVTIPFTVGNAAGAESTRNLKVTVAGTTAAPTLTPVPAMTSLELIATSGDPTVVGDTVKYKVVSTFNKGRIKLGAAESPRTGEVTGFTYTGTGLAGTVNYVDSGGLTAVQTIAEFSRVTTGSPVTFTSKANYLVGPQPKDSRGNNFGDPYAAGSSSTKSFTVPAATKYKWWATTGTNATTQVLQPALDKAAMASDGDGKFIQLIMAQQLVAGERNQISIPQAWGGIKGMKVLGYDGVTWQWMGFSAGDFADRYTHSTETRTIGGTAYTYDKYLGVPGLQFSARELRIYLN
jgi:VCBS repeat-containing protein